MEIVIRGGHVVPGADLPEIPRGDVLVRDGMIVSVGPPVDAAVPVIDATGLVVAPGFVDAHRHVWQAPLRGLGADMAMPRYFAEILGAALHSYTPAEARLATLLGAVEALDAGVTTLFDWSNATTRGPDHTDAVLDAFEAAGVRAVVGHTDPGDDARRLASRHGRVTGALAVLGGEYGDWDEFVAQLRWGRDLGLMVALHAGGPVVRPLHDAGLLGPDLQLVHLNAITPDDAKLLADTGTPAVVTPTVEAVMGHGPSAYGRLEDAGARPALGVDVVINSAPDLFEPMRDTLRTRRLSSSADRPPAASILRAATIDSARAAGLSDRTGSIEVGKRADLVLLDGLSHLTGTAGDLAGAVVSSLTPSHVRTVLVDGVVLKRDGRLLYHDLPVLRAQAAPLGTRSRT
ncbi:amidohydrolase family protein [Virgisporangium ochraceum]|uniref:TRZ/ATZ family hydrolase n=1 Tax=Virgisporangium ochraceum TaxID=65505 RepID=A0A8J3ZP76_9ACTN|nr:amidohydrolase family protein [Virgisporangium ochraceum]GIJ67637.1 TRZ/ATZ family hydrolase [Virgisporangium ochraceum]